MKGNPQEGKALCLGNELWVDTWDISLRPQYICPPMRFAQLIIFARNYGMRRSSGGLVARRLFGQ